MPGTREMSAAGSVAHVLSCELGARAGVEHMRVAVQLTLERLPIDQTNGSRPGDRTETACRWRRTRREPGRGRKGGPAAIQDNGLEAEILQDEPHPRGIGHLAAVVDHGNSRR